MMITNILSCILVIFVFNTLHLLTVFATMRDCDFNLSLITPEEIDVSLKRYSVVPDVASSAPPFFAKIIYHPGLCPVLGELVTSNRLGQFPQRIEWPGYDDTYYTLIVTDLDAPSRAAPYEREWLHWLVVNIKGPVMLARETIVDYIGPIPLIGTGPHRYVFSVFEQPEKMDFKEVHMKAIRTDPRRTKFSTRAYARRYKLEPFAINFFRAQWAPKNYTENRGKHFF